MSAPADPPTATRADPKDRRELAGEIARVTSGELRGKELERALRRILAADPANPQANMRLGFALSESGRCPEALEHFRAAIAGGMPGADPHLGLARCHALSRRFEAAAIELRAADGAEPGQSGGPGQPRDRAVRWRPPSRRGRAARAGALDRSGLPRGALQPRGRPRPRRRPGGRGARRPRSCCAGCRRTRRSGPRFSGC